MSAISSIGGSASDPRSLFLQQLQGARTNDGDGDDGPNSVKAKNGFESALKAAGADPSKISDIESQIKTAIQNAQQNAGTSGTGQTAVRDAIDNVLKQNGVDVDKFKAQVQANKSQRHHRHHAQGAQATQSQNTGATSASTLLANVSTAGVTGLGTVVDAAA